MIIIFIIAGNQNNSYNYYLSTSDNHTSKLLYQDIYDPNHSTQEQDTSDTNLVEDTSQDTSQDTNSESDVQERVLISMYTHNL